MKKLTPIPLDWFVTNLRDGRNFSFARYGDGEWLTILGEYGRKNSNGCTFTKPLSDDLRLVLSRALPYRHAILGIAKRKQGHLIDRFISKHKVSIKWYKGDVLLDKSLKGLIFPLIEQLREKRVLYVGPSHCQRLNENFFEYVHYIQPPPQNAHGRKAAIIREVLSAIEHHNAEVIGWSSGLAAKVFIDEVFMHTKGQITQIDFGSMFDGYFDIPSRNYIRRGGIKWRLLESVNTGKVERPSGENFRW